MKKVTQFLLVFFCLGLSLTALAQDKKDEKDDSQYLVGAVPEVDGKIVFTKEYQIPGMGQEEIFNRVQKWLDTRLKKNANNSRIVYTNQEKGQVVGLGEEWIVFRSSALSLDRTEIQYQLSVTCQPEKCCMEIEKIRFEYREGEEKYTAEEWISDKYALNKAKTKLVRGLAKWRKKTVDFMDDYGKELANALSLSPAEPEVAEQKTERKEGPTVIVPQQKVTVTPQKTETVAANPVVSTPAKAASTTGTTYTEMVPAELPTNLIQMGTGKLVLVIGTDEFNMTMMTANAGGSLGKMSGKPVIYSFLSPDQPHTAMDQAESYAVRFYPAGENTPSVVLECKKLPSQTPLEGQPRMYVGEIIKAKVKK